MRGYFRPRSSDRSDRLRNLSPVGFKTLIVGGIIFVRNSLLVVVGTALVGQRGRLHEPQRDRAVAGHIQV